MELQLQNTLVTLWVNKDDKGELKTNYYVNVVNEFNGEKIYAKVRLILTKKCVIKRKEVTASSTENNYYGWFNIKGFLSCYQGKDSVVVTIIAQAIEVAPKPEKVETTKPVATKPVVAKKAWKMKEEDLTKDSSEDLPF